MFGNERIKDLENQVRRLTTDKNILVLERDGARSEVQFWMGIAEARQTRIDNLNQKLKGIRDVLDPPADKPVWCRCKSPVVQSGTFGCKLCGRRVDNTAPAASPGVPECACRAAEAAAAWRAQVDLVDYLRRGIRTRWCL